MIRQCCKCRNIWKNGRWAVPQLKDLAEQDISHCYCDTCFQEEMAMLRVHRRAAPRAPVTHDLRRLFR